VSNGFGVLSLARAADGSLGIGLRSPVDAVVFVSVGLVEMPVPGFRWNRQAKVQIGNSGIRKVEAG
jgi:hypothetical protein